MAAFCLAEADSLCREALSMRRKLLGDAHPQLAQSLQHLGTILVAERKWDDAENSVREALLIERKLQLDLQAMTSLPGDEKAGPKA